MSGGQHITVKPTSRISSDEARDARARAWSFVFKCWQEKQKAAPASRLYDAEGEFDGIRATSILSGNP